MFLTVYSQNSFVSSATTTSLKLVKHLGSSIASSDLNQYLEVCRNPSSTDVKTSTVASDIEFSAVGANHIESYSNYFDNCQRARNEHLTQRLSTASSQFGTAEEVAV